MEETKIIKRPFKWVGGWLCLDFANSKNWGTDELIYERFFSYEDLVLWNQAANRLPTPAGEQLMLEARQRPAEAERVFEQAMALRKLIQRLFGAIAHGVPPQARDLAEVNEAVALVLAQSKINPAKAGREKFQWGWAGPEQSLERVLWPIVWSVAELLLSDKLSRVGQCAAENCGWLFLDTTRNHSRRWCEMEHCGNRAKAKRHYRRRRASDNPEL